MRHVLMRALIWLAAAPVAAQDRAGDFGYFVLALSWSPSWCAAEGRDDADQCDPRRDLGFVVHGLWPQHERGWPEHCDTDARGPTRAQSAAMADIMGSAGLAWAQWRKHGRCTGLDGAAYLALTRAALARVRIPPALRATDRDRSVSPRMIEAAFLQANPAMAADGVTVTCAQGRLREVRICLTRDLDPRPCAPDAARDCRAPTITAPAPP